MLAAFVTPLLPPSRGRTTHRHWTCATKPGTPQPPPPGSAGSDRFADMDQRYMDKIRAKLFNVRRAADAARGPPDTSDTDALLTASLPDNLDEIEDILFDRGPRNVNQVKLFGGWLDDSVAGRKASDPRVVADDVGDGAGDGQFDVESFHKISLTKQEALDRANATFASAMTAFNKGQYKQAVGLYEEAVQYVGVESRLGGQYQLWLAQALDAAGEKGRAATMLQALRTHADSDVRKVSRELLFIITAPPLEFEPGSFLNIPSLDDEPRSAQSLPLLTSFGPLRTALVEKKPEPHTLEWYMQKERPPKMVDNSGMEAILVAAAIGFTLAFMFSSSPT